MTSGSGHGQVGATATGDVQDFQFHDDPAGLAETIDENDLETQAALAYIREGTVGAGGAVIGEQGHFQPSRHNLTESDIAGDATPVLNSEIPDDLVADVMMGMSAGQQQLHEQMQQAQQQQQQQFIQSQRMDYGESGLQLTQRQKEQEDRMNASLVPNTEQIL